MKIPVQAQQWTPPVLPTDIPGGDMPGDKISIGDEHIAKAQTIFPLLLDELAAIDSERAVVSIYGGSGVGKSEISSIIGWYLNELGVGAYVLSGDNYALRIPKYNDAERERVAEEGGDDALKKYLGSEMEINFKEVREIIRLFHEGEQEIYLRRMGRTETELWYDAVDFSETKVLIVEWTHGNNKNLSGVDIPVFLGSTPAETLAHRIKRNRDGKPDSPFVTKVLEIEQDLLTSQVKDAKIIISKAGEIISDEEYMRRIINS